MAFSPSGDHLGLGFADGSVQVVEWPGLRTKLDLRCAGGVGRAGAMRGCECVVGEELGWAAWHMRCRVQSGDPKQPGACQEQRSEHGAGLPCSVQWACHVACAEPAISEQTSCLEERHGLSIIPMRLAHNMCKQRGQEAG